MGLLLLLFLTFVNGLLAEPTNLSSAGEHRNGAPGSPEIEVSCADNQLVLSVSKKWNEAELKAEALYLGNECRSNGESSNRLVFTYSLSQCATKRTTANGNEVYSNVLLYAPGALYPALLPGGGMVIPFTCTPEKVQKVNADPFMTPAPPSSESIDFGLKTMNSSWTGDAETNVYQRGQPMHFQVTAGHVAEGQQLYILSCFANTSPDPEARPHLRVIVKKGCISYVASKRGQARFVPSGKRNAVNFIISAFRFSSPEIYLHCELAVDERKETPSSKSCNYNQEKLWWEELNGDTAVCSCCRTACGDSAPKGSQIRVSSGPLIIMHQAEVEHLEAPTPAPLLNEIVSPETGMPPLGDATAVGHLEGTQQGWMWPSEGWPTVPEQSGIAMEQSSGYGLFQGSAPHDAYNFAPNYLDGFPVLQQEWGTPPSAPQGWLAGTSAPRITWVFPPVMGQGMVVMKRAPEEPGLNMIVRMSMMNNAPEKREGYPEHPHHDATAQEQREETPLQFLGDDPSALEGLKQVLKGEEQWGGKNVDRTVNPNLMTEDVQFSQPPAGSSKDDMFNSVLEESKRKQWGGKLGIHQLLTQEGNVGSSLASPYTAQYDPRPEGADRSPDPQDDAQLNSSLEDEGLVLKKSTVMLHKAKGQQEPALLKAIRSQLELTLSAEPSLRYEEEEAGLGDRDRMMKRRILFEEENVHPSLLQDLLRRMYKAE